MARGGAASKGFGFTTGVAMIQTRTRITDEQMRMAAQYAAGRRDGLSEARGEASDFRWDLAGGLFLLAMCSGLFWRELFAFFVG